MSPSGRYAGAHAHPEGPGDARPTAVTIVQDEDLVGQLSAKVILITGASSGIGVETARALHITGVHLYLAVRDLTKGQEVVDDILKANPGQGHVDLLQLELDSLESVRSCVSTFLSKSKQLNVLINNAGVMACPEGQTKDGFETQFGTNHLGHFLLFQLLKPTLLASSTPAFPSRIVSLSSSGHRFSPILFNDLDMKERGYDPWVGYGQAKTANIYLANEIERRYGSRGLHATSVMPGGIFTNLSRHLDPSTFTAFDSPEVKRKLKSVEQGAATTVWAAIGREWAHMGGRYLEDCSEAAPTPPGLTGNLLPGYAPHAYDAEAAKKLWSVSCKLVGLPDDGDE